uniref:type I restriction endonuclease n=1 Tax=Micrococcus luteus TaxID=1270 RepID=UPI0022DF4D01
MTEFEDKLAQVARRARDYASSLDTEEATKNALVMPFISQVLGYDVFDPQEVVPEFVADLGLKKGEKIDYAIMREGKVNILVEAKKVGSELSLAHASQLVRYFHTSEARIGVLTNGRVWNFYTDLDKANILDERPFLVLDLLDIDPVTVPKLEQLAKGSFDLDSVIAAAEELKYVSAIKREISAEMAAPSDELVKVLAKRVYSGYMNAKAVETFTRLTEEAARQYINDRVNARLKTALGDQVAPVLAAPAEPVATGDQTVSRPLHSVRTF